MNTRAIGIFDSGVGGLTALRTLRHRLPGEALIYFGDTARMPYGPLSRETVVQYARQDAAFLSTFDVKALIIACGTITVSALDTLTSELDIPVIGVVAPSCQAAAAATKNRRIGLVATEASVRSGAYEAALRRIDAELSVFSQACPRLAPLVEAGHTALGDPLAEEAVREYAAPLLAEGIDTLILGCTHYPLLREVFACVCGPGVTLVDAGAAAAEQAAQLLEKDRLLSERQKGDTRLFVSGETAAFEAVASAFLGWDVTGTVAHIDIERY